jgi:hypothetical protein
MAAGLSVALLWRDTGFNEAVYEGLPGMAAAFAVWIGGRLLYRLQDRGSRTPRPASDGHSDQQ